MRALLLLSIVACQPSAPRPLAAPTSRPATLGANDVLDVRIYQEPDLTGVYRIASDGTINFPLLGTLTVAGMTAREVGDLITRRLRDGYIKNPQVRLEVKEYNNRKISVLGAVARPGEYPYVEDMSIVSAIAQAGGFTRVAAPNQTIVKRVVDGRDVITTVHVDDIGKSNEQNFTLAPGDIVTVPESVF